MELLLGQNNSVMLAGLANLVQPATKVSLAVSYIQVSGWELLSSHVPKNALGSMRVLCDDKMGITNPEAVRRMLDAGIDVRAFSGFEIYHPKVYLAVREDGTKAILGSANLSESALKTSVEAGILIDDDEEILSNWFDQLFVDRSAVFDADRLSKLDENFRKRVKGELLRRRDRPDAEEIGSDANLVDRVFSILGEYVAPLSFDHGKNNVRSLQKAWEVAKLDPGQWSQVQEAELKFSGLADGKTLTVLGSDIANSASIEEVVSKWVAWLKRTPEADLPYRKFDNLAVAKKAFDSFFNLKKEVQEFFIELAVSGDAEDRPILQAIELLANAAPVGEDLDLDEVKTLAPLLTEPAKFPSNVSRAVRTYIENKASRTWGLPERRLLLEAWRET